jgi:hypothetical protein
MKIRKIIFNPNAVIWLISVLGFTCCFGQKSNDGQSGSSSPRISDSTEAEIVQIRKEYNRTISDEPKCNVLTGDLNDRSTEGGEMKTFYLGKSLQKARLIYYGETGKAVFEYYFQDGVVFFILKRTYNYNIPIYMKGSRVSKIEEEKFYFNRQKLIRWIGPTGKIIPASQYPAKEKEIEKDLGDTVFKK